MSLDDFMVNHIEVERRRRIRLSLAAYAYEFDNNSIMSDADFDKLALQIKPELSTIEEYQLPEQKDRYRLLDKFFQDEFQPDTGQWVHKHPELNKLANLYKKLYNIKIS